MNNFSYGLHYVHAPVIRERSDDHLILESIRNKVWNPVFTIGVITFVLSMVLRGFFDQHYAVIPLALSTFVLFSGVWILSAAALIVFDKKDSKIYLVYKHLGYLQKIYVHSMSSFDEVELVDPGSGRWVLQLQKDDGSVIKIAGRNNRPMLENTAKEISDFLNIPIKA